MSGLSYDTSTESLACPNVLYFLAYYDNSNDVFLDVPFVAMIDNFLILFLEVMQGHEPGSNL